jgi:DNA-binding NtrC family response regulator
MKKEIILVSMDKKFARDMQAALSESDYAVHRISAVETIIQRVQAGERQIVLLDFDTLALDNNQIKAIQHKNPGTVLIGSSSRTFHPELKEALSRHFFACFTKPINLEELQYLLKGVVI